MQRDEGIELKGGLQTAHWYGGDRGGDRGTESEGDLSQQRVAVSACERWTRDFAEIECEVGCDGQGNPRGESAANEGAHFEEHHHAE